MNKVLKGLVLLSVLFFSSSVASAAELDSPLNCCILRSDVELDGVPYSKDDTVGDGEECFLEGSTNPYTGITNQWGLVCLLGSIGGVSHWIFVMLMIVSPLMIMFGAYHIMTAGAEPEKVKTGKNYIIWATVGLLVGLFSNAIPNFVASLITG